MGGAYITVRLDGFEFGLLLLAVFVIGLAVGFLARPRATRVAD